MREIMEEYGPAIIVFIVTILIIGVVSVAIGTSSGVFGKLISEFFNAANAAGNLNIDINDMITPAI